MIKIGCRGPIKYLASETERLHNLGCKIYDCNIPTQNIAELLKGYTYIIAGGEYYDANTLKILADNGLKMIVRMGVGYDHIDLEAARAHGIIVANAPGANAQSVAEHALTLTMAAARGMGINNTQMHEGIWETPCMRDLSGRTFGLMGFGNIAQHYARMIKPLAGKIIAYDLYFNKNKADEIGVEYAGIDELLAQSDVLSIHVPMTNETRDFLNEDRINQMKQGAIVINTSRGEIVNEQALYNALISNRLFAAGLDVFHHEPLEKESLLRQLDNCVMTSHCASLTPEAFRSMLLNNLATIEAHITGRGNIPRVN